MNIRLFYVLISLNCLGFQSNASMQSSQFFQGQVPLNSMSSGFPGANPLPSSQNPQGNGTGDIPGDSPDISGFSPTGGTVTPDSGDADGSGAGGDSDSGDGGGDSNPGSPPPDPTSLSQTSMNPFFMTPPPPPEPVECFGIMGVGQNDNVFVDQDGTQYGYGEAPACHPLGSLLLPKDSAYGCENIVVGQTDKGELIRGSLKPDPRRRSPMVCYPYDFVNQQITYMNPAYAVPLSS